MSEVLKRNSNLYGDRLAVADLNRSLNWSELEASVMRLAGELTVRRVEVGDRVLVLSNDRVEVVQLYFALSWISAVYVPMNHNATSDEIRYLLETVQPRLVVGEAELLTKHRAAFVGLLDAGSTMLLDDGELDFGKTGFVGTPILGEWSSPAAIIHTSATTGRPKGAVFDHRSLKDHCLGIMASMPVSSDDVLVSCCPLFHSSAILGLAFMTAGAGIVVMPGFTPKRALQAISKYRASHLWLTPEMLRFVLRSPGFASADLASLREVVYGAAQMPIDLYREAATALDVGFRQNYGMTEAGGPIALLAPEEHPDPHDLDGVDDIAAGHAAVGFSIAVRDQQGRLLPSCELGEIIAAGAGIMTGYLDRPDAYDEAVRDGWLCTGDLGYIDDSGLLHVRDRIKDVVIRGGQNIYPAEIERVLGNHPAVDSVAVVGAPDLDWGEVPVAFVVLRGESTASESELVRHVVDTMSSYKRPREIRIVPDLPRSASGKILKRVLRAEASAQ
ncbi:class I adenylate-forming enzyme family protein [Nocardia sp. NPDC059177]|uniref:class I adenylate-forming enzyme family protein n=1 Tax=Nocardia sp. NPDC059177 TaxID=3346759 RepID=UPI003688B2AC